MDGTSKRGPRPLAEPNGHGMCLRLTDELKRELDAWGRRHGIGSRAEVLRLAARRLLDEEGHNGP